MLRLVTRSHLSVVCWLEGSVFDVVLRSVNIDAHSIAECSCQVPGCSRPPGGDSIRLSDQAGVGAGAGQGALHGAGDLRLQTGDDASDEVRLINRGTGGAGGAGGGAEPARGGSGKS